ncbi:hypothetical protein CCY01nite_13930 [Chitinophaga cymbidii]|uniref:Uncharacterized protein n=1 Tax=Chitinophaga cymbidii TaxID=1096750 RepID=A0A512RHF2_9BACT|nr:hypothetical protein CCY01nite_13930 [Chitinophaga cymbidii]
MKMQKRVRSNWRTQGSFKQDDRLVEESGFPEPDWQEYPRDNGKKVY